jgi:hypothetical protein
MEITRGTIDIRGDLRPLAADDMTECRTDDTRPDEERSEPGLEGSLGVWATREVPVGSERTDEPQIDRQVTQRISELG